MIYQHLGLFLVVSKTISVYIKWRYLLYVRLQEVLGNNSIQPSLTYFSQKVPTQEVSFDISSEIGVETQKTSIWKRYLKIPVGDKEIEIAQSLPPSIRNAMLVRHDKKQTQRLLTCFNQDFSSIKVIY